VRRKPARSTTIVSRGRPRRFAVQTTCPIRKAAMISDGTIAAISTLTGDTSAAIAKITSGIDGGKIGPSVAAAMQMPAANSSS
jgi:hypothetical protein